MDSRKIYKLADELTEKQVYNVVAGWEAGIGANSSEKLATYHTLVRLGDSKELACATCILDCEKKESDLQHFNYS